MLYATILIMTGEVLVEHAVGKCERALSCDKNIDIAPISSHPPPPCFLMHLYVDSSVCSVA